MLEVKEMASADSLEPWGSKEVPRGPMRKARKGHAGQALGLVSSSIRGALLLLVLYIEVLLLKKKKGEKHCITTVGN